MTQEIERAAEAASVVSTPVVYSVAGMTFFNISVQDWILIGTGVLLAFNITFACFKLRDLIRGKRNVN